MPYNTRRKSLSLPSLGIHVPITHAARTAHLRGGASTASPSAHRHPSPPSSSSSTSTVLEAPSDSSHRHPNKKVKRSHGSGSGSGSISSLASTATTAADAGANATASTPPPSPKHIRHLSVEMDDSSDAPAAETETETEIDIDAINDDIVEAVILQLLATGNRPHLIKELSAILMQHLRSVQQSANPCAIISSRLATFMKRPSWSASMRCPLAKELETIHPRRTYYFLTTCAHLPLPDASSPAFIVPRTSIITPPLSSAASGSESAEEERQRELSPSPEVDLSSPEFDDVDDDIPMPGTPIGSSSLRFSRVSHSGYVPRNQRGASPPLEKDEKEFTQTAEGLQKRKLAGHALLMPSALPAVVSSPSSADAPHLIQSTEMDDAARDESVLFGFESRHLSVHSVNGFTVATSPAMRPTFALGQKKESDGWAKLDSLLDWDRSPENIELDELDGLLDDF